MRRYCVLWIPTATHQRILPIDPVFSKRQMLQWDKDFTRSIEFEYQINPNGEADVNGDLKISGIPVNDNIGEKVFLDFTLMKEGDFPPDQDIYRYECHIKPAAPLRHILVEAKLDSGIVFDTLFLQCLDTNANGLFLYSYIVPEKYLQQKSQSEKRYLLNSKFNVTNAVYHWIKLFFHIHESHDASKDSILSPYSSDQLIYISRPHNNAIRHYLSKFEAIIHDQYKCICELRHSIDNMYRDALEMLDKTDRIKHAETYESYLNEKLWCLENNYPSCIKQCHKALRMYPYFNTLLFRNTDLANGHASLNIHNLFKAIIYIQQEISTHIQIEFHKLAIHNGEILSRQNKDIKKQTETISKQNGSLKNLTIEVANTSSKLTKKMFWYGVLCSFLASLFFYILSEYL